jgi:hypothetical protein
MAGTTSLAMDDPEHAQLAGQGIGEEGVEGAGGLRHGEPVQVELRIDAVVAAPQLAKNLLGDAGAAKLQFLAGLDHRRQRLAQVRKALGEHRLAVGLREVGLRPRPRPRAQLPRLHPQAPYAPHGGAKQRGLAVLNLLDVLSAHTPASLPCSAPRSARRPRFSSIFATVVPGLESR